MGMGDMAAEDLVGEEWAEWYRLTPQARFLESTKLWETYLALGGSLDPEPDTQSPFFDPDEWREDSSCSSSAGNGEGVPPLRSRSERMKKQRKHYTPEEKGHPEAEFAGQGAHLEALR